MNVLDALESDTVRVELVELAEGKSTHRILIRRRATVGLPWRLSLVKTYTEERRARLAFQQIELPSTTEETA